jgi:hypothetical protein
VTDAVVDQVVKTVGDSAVGDAVGGGGRLPGTPDLPDLP